MFVCDLTRKRIRRLLNSFAVRETSLEWISVDTRRRKSLRLVLMKCKMIWYLLWAVFILATFDRGLAP